MKPDHVWRMGDENGVSGDLRQMNEDYCNNRGVSVGDAVEWGVEGEAPPEIGEMVMDWMVVLIEDDSGFGGELLVIFATWEGVSVGEGRRSKIKRERRRLRGKTREIEPRRKIEPQRRKGAKKRRDKRIIGRKARL